MNGERVLLDSVILIDHFNGIESAGAFLEKLGDSGHVSAITRAEVLSGFGPGDSGKARMLLDLFQQVPIDAPVADLAGELRRRFKWRLPDALQAAAATHHGLRLATRNTKDFSPRRFDFVLIPYTL